MIITKTEEEKKFTWPLHIIVSWFLVFLLFVLLLLSLVMLAVCCVVYNQIFLLFALFRFPETFALYALRVLSVLLSYYLLLCTRWYTHTHTHNSNNVAILHTVFRSILFHALQQYTHTHKHARSVYLPTRGCLTSVHSKHISYPDHLSLLCVLN